MLQEQDTCRICSGPGEDGQPLFYPCKCSGTIRYIHQDCLKTWLDHSKKTTCDVCKHPYAFTKVYRPDMPESVPVAILIRKFAEQLAAVIIFTLRATLVAFVWLILLPYGTVLTWRLYFRMGDILAWGISLHNRPDAHNVTLRTFRNHTAISLSDVSLQQYLRTLSTDIFTGQIIASLIVLAFLAVFLLREWIQQNALPGVFDDVPAGAQAELEAHRQDAPAQLENDHDHGPRAPDEGEEGVDAGMALEGLPPPIQEPPLDFAARPVPDVPEDVHLASPACSSSSSSSDTEDLPSRPAYVRAVEHPSPSFGRRRRVQDGARRRVRRIGAGAATHKHGMRRRLRSLDDENSSVDIPLVAQLREVAEPPRWDNETTSQWKLNERFALEGIPSESKEHAERCRRNSDTVSGIKTKSGQKRKADDGEIEWANGRRAVPVQRSISPKNTGFDFTFHPTGSVLLQPSTSIPTFAFPGDDEFKFILDASLKVFVPPPDNEPKNSHSVVTQSENKSLELPLPPGNRSAFEEPPYPLIPFGSTPLSMLQRPSSGGSDIASTSSFRFTFTAPPIPSFTSSQLPYRPAQLSSIVPLLDPKNTEASTSAITSSGTHPLPTPDLTTYRPSEFEADDSNHSDDRERADSPLGAEPDNEMDVNDARFDRYFEEPDFEDTKETPQPLLLPDTDDEDDEEEDEDDAHDAEEPREAGPHVGADAPRLVAGDGPVQEAEAVEVVDEERDQNLEEDLDGAMEAVGLRGPVSAVFQNAALMLFILNVSIGGGIWVPFTLGKTMALLTLEPRRSLQILHLPIRAVRLVTDPSADVVIYVLRFIIISLLEWGKLICLWMLPPVGIVRGKVPPKTWSCLSHWTDLQQIADHFRNSGEKNKLIAATDPSVLWSMSGEGIRSYARFIMPRDPALFSLTASASSASLFLYAEEIFAVLGRHVRLGATAVWKGWVDIAEGDGTVERVSAIFLGYAIAAFLASLYLNTFTVGNVKSAGRAVRNAIRQQMIVLKVALFIVVELVMFPFGCGVMLDFSTLTLFPEATVESRLAFFFYAPITAAFYHWLVGTMFMYQFAILLATCREILRSGCMWFIKDPQDPTFHPIRDILDRPTFAQLRKLFMSAVMYAFVITLGVGCIVSALTAVTIPILPLRWKMREPLWEIPVDLLFVHLILPPSLHYFRPRRTIRYLMTAWWKWTARRLRLTSFMFGGRHPHEEYTPAHWSLRNFVSDNEEGLVDLEAVRDGSFRRVPAGDNIAFLRDKPALVPVDEDGNALDESGKDIMLAQNAEARQAGRNYRDDYTVVYVPPHFRSRVFSFIVLFWLSGSAAMVTALFVPILLGRAMFRVFSPRYLHDGYSFAVGFYLLWWGWLVGMLVVRIRIRRQRHTGSRRIRAGWFLFLIKRVIVYFTKVTWMALWLGIVLPTLVSIAVDLYVVFPLRHFFNADFSPTLHIVESWATGLVLSRIIVRTQRPRPGADLMGALEAIQRNGWRRPDPLAATRDFIIPVGTGLLGMIIIPPLFLFGCSKVVAPPWPMELLFRLVYPSLFLTVAAFQFAMSLVGVFAKWTQGIRDKEFLMELRLRNLEDARAKPE